MSPKDFRKICHPEAKILNSLVNCSQTDRQTVETRCRADPTSSGSAKNESIRKGIALSNDGLEIGLNFVRNMYLPRGIK